MKTINLDNYREYLEQIRPLQEEYLGVSKPVNDKKPLVSVFVITYQHGPYISDCLDSILSQETNFDYEIVVGEDDSTDGTREICKRYAEKHQDKIRLFLRDRSQSVVRFDNRIIHINNKLTFSSCRGRYIAICEGDDYWTDSRKLQKQFDFIVDNKDCSFVFHAVEQINMRTGKRLIRRPRHVSDDNKLSIRDMIFGSSAVASNSIFYRKEYMSEYPDWMLLSPVGDLALKLMMAYKGNVGYIDEVLSAYRMFVPGSWSDIMLDNKMRRNHNVGVVRMFRGFDKWTAYKYHKLIVINEIYLRFEHSAKLFKRRLKKFIIQDENK